MSSCICFLYVTDLSLPFTVQLWWRKVWRAERAQQDYHAILHQVSCLGGWNLECFEWGLFFPFLISSANPCLWTGQGRTKLPPSSCISSIVYAASTGIILRAIQHQKGCRRDSLWVSLTAYLTSTNISCPSFGLAAQLTHLFPSSKR